MAENRLARLTESQRACLRRVLMHMSSKDIARELGISPHTVDQRLRVAMQTLGATSRVEAARMLAAHEGVAGVAPLGAYQTLIYQAPDIAAEPDPVTMAPSADHGTRQRDQAYADAVREEAVAFDTFSPLPLRSFHMPLPGEGRWWNDLNSYERLGACIAIAILGLLAFGVLINGLMSLGQVFAS